jgi:hypothetical protein
MNSKLDLLLSEVCELRKANVVMEERLKLLTEHAESSGQVRDPIITY